MSRTKKISGLFLVLLLLASSAFASPVLGPNLNQIEFINWENAYYLDGSQWVSRGQDGEIQIGDVFVGIIRAQTITNKGKEIWNSQSAVGSIDNLSGYFVNKVLDIFVDSTGPKIILGASKVDPFGVFKKEDFDADVVMKLFADNTTIVDPTSVSGGINTATDGTLWASLSVNKGYAWSSAQALFGVDEEIGTNWFGYNVVDGVLGGLFPINDPKESLFNKTVEIYGHSLITLNDDPDTNEAWAFASNDPATLATPEPASMILLGAGLLGLFVARRRKSFN